MRRLEFNWRLFSKYNFKLFFTSRFTTVVSKWYWKQLRNKIKQIWKHALDFYAFSCSNLHFTFSCMQKTRWTRWTTSWKSRRSSRLDDSGFASLRFSNSEYIMFVSLLCVNLMNSGVMKKNFKLNLRFNNFPKQIFISQ